LELVKEVLGGIIAKINKQCMKTLLFDIETTPNTAYVWGTYEQNVIEFTEHSKIITFAYKWLDKKKVSVIGLDDVSSYEELIRILWELFDEADIIIGHNGDKFDIKRANTEFIKCGFSVPSFYRTIDTLKVARKYFKFNSNKLDDLGEVLGLGRKAHSSWEIWKGCMENNPKSYALMKRYNKQDVVLLENVYLELRKWIYNHPNVNLDTNKIDCCPTCGSLNVLKRGFGYSKVGKYQRFQCKDCGSWCSGKTITNGLIIK
jgi:DNA polymerase elongation subunit (family B)